MAESWEELVAEALQEASGPYVVNVRGGRLAVEDIAAALAAAAGTGDGGRREP